MVNCEQASKSPVIHFYKPELILAWELQQNKNHNNTISLSGKDPLCLKYTLLKEKKCIQINTSSLLP